MKEKLVIVILFSMCYRLVAQDTTKTVVRRITSTTSMKVDTNQVIYNESGQALKYFKYHKLLQSGEYTIRFDGIPDDPKTKKYLKKLTEQDKIRGIQMLESIASARSPVLVKNSALDINPLLYYATLAELENKPILIYFWTEGCIPCIENFSQVDEMLEQVGHAEDLAVFYITSATRAKALGLMGKKPLQKKNLISEGQSVFQAYQVNSFPAFVIADKNRIIRFAVSGFGPYTLPSVKKNLISLFQ